MIISREFRDQLPVAIMILLLSTIGLVVVSAPRTALEQVAALSTESLNELSAE